MMEMPAEGSSRDAYAEDRPPRSSEPSSGPATRGPGGRSSRSYGGATRGRGRGLADGTPAEDVQARFASDPDSPYASGNVEERPVSYTPLFEAQHEARYLRRNLIREYQQKHHCRLGVMIDLIHPDSITLFAELLHGADPGKEFHLLLRSPGGDGEVAIRLARMAQASCSRFVVVVPDIAKSAATIFALGADQIVMGSPSDLGPIDPQVLVPDRGYVSAKGVIAAVDDALDDVHKRSGTYALHSALLGMGNVDATLYQAAKAALGQAREIARQAIASNPRRPGESVAALVDAVADRLIADPRAHSAVIGTAEARSVGLPVKELEPSCEWWQEIWTIWTRYFALGVDDKLIYEGETASQVYSRFFEPPDRTEPDRSRTSSDLQ
jgi:hypothetical protein